MNYQQAMEYIEKCAGYGIVPGVSTMRELLNRLGNPQKGLKIIHLAGTNGKGSVLAFLATVLRTCGYRTGTYLSPVIFDYRERFSCNGKPVSKAETARLMEEVAQAAEEMESEGFPHPTPFEIETAMSFLLFQRKNCELVVLETGLGGREDATNVIEDPLICVITSVSRDHMSFLGESLEEIAEHKAGIIKRGAVVVSAPQEEEAVREVIRRSVREAGAKELCFLDRGKIKRRKSTLKEQSFSYGNYRDLKISMTGIYQIENAALALEVLDRLRLLGYKLEEKKLRKGMLETSWPGRFQILCQNPVFIADGAHNEGGALSLRKSLEFYFANRRILFIMGMFRDKECEKVIANTADLAEQIITVAARNNPRALGAYELAGIVSRYHPGVTAADSIEEAVELAFLLADSRTVIVAFGSLAYLGDCIETVLHRNEMRKDTHGK